MSELSNNGGPAFPTRGYGRPAASREEAVERKRMEGLSVRDYFAAHAPPIPDWWPDADEVPPTPEPSFLGDGTVMREMWFYWIESPDAYRESRIPADMLEEFKKHHALYEQQCEEREKAVIMAHMERETNWRYCYAAAMLAARAKKI